MPRLGGGWRNASGDGRNKSGLYLHFVYLAQTIAGEAGLPRGTPSLARHVGAAAGGTRQETAGINPACIFTSSICLKRSRVRQASPAEPPPLHATFGRRLEERVRRRPESIRPVSSPRPFASNERG